jgi:probable rRNA maturation factor
MLAPPGWVEPAQTPEFDEVVFVVMGTLTLLVNGKREKIGANEFGLVPKGSRVIYRNDDNEPCDYLSVCAPAFLPELAHMEAPEEPELGRVSVSTAHPEAAKHAKRLATLGEEFLDKLDLKESELSLSLVTDRAIRRLNRTWRKKDKPTDVLSFPAGDLPKGVPGPKPLGDVVISIDTAKRQAKEHGRTLSDELALYLAHGLLHLLGYDHERGPADARKMAQMEEKLLGSAGMLRNSPELLMPDPKSRARKHLH